jgi:hypothetical protein
VTGYWPQAIAGYLTVVVLALGAIALRPGRTDTVPRPIPVALVALTVVAAVGYGLALEWDRYRAAFVAVAAMVYALVGLVAATLYSAFGGRSNRARRSEPGRKRNAQRSVSSCPLFHHVHSDPF